MTSTFAFISGLGAQEILIIALFALIFFGAQRIPEFRKDLVKVSKNLKGQ
jgi:sec-independent protein translocase protein TatA